MWLATALFVSLVRKNMRMPAMAIQIRQMQPFHTASRERERKIRSILSIKRTYEESMEHKGRHMSQI